LAWLGAWLAANMGMEATANAIVIKLFFIFFSPLRAVLPAHNSIIGRLASKLDSLRKLCRPTNSGLSRLSFVSL